MSRTSRQWLRTAALGLALSLLPAAAQDLQTARAQPDPVKRAKLALANAERAATKATEACPSGDYEACNFRLDEVQASVELTEDSLDKSGIDPIRRPQHYKEAEIGTRKILRQLEGLRARLHPDDLPHFDRVFRRVSDINDRLLSAIMTGGKKKKKK